MMVCKTSLAFFCLINITLILRIPSLAQNTPQDYLDAHNAARAAVDVGPLTWDTSVQSYAQNYANQRAGDCALRHSGGRYGENLAWSSGALSAADAVNLWVDEKAYYVYNSNSCAPGKMCGHYTQVVWRDSLRLGCARVRCTNGGIFIICNYDPPGNYVGRRPYGSDLSPSPSPSLPGPNLSPLPSLPGPNLSPLPSRSGPLIQYTGPKKQHTGLAIGISASILAFLIISVATAVYLIRKIKNADIIEAWELETGPHRYSYQELKKATNNFGDKELLGKGGFGQVYKGKISGSRNEVAVKRISKESTQGLREFASEIASIGQFRHRNLVQLLGWCRKRNDFLLVYDYMANGSLDKFLFDKPKIVLNWEQRMKIVKDVASGLLYLHEGYEQVVIHRDVKASNVLLDGDLNARLGDFGLARLYEHGANPNTTRVVGTFGYLAPELPRTGKATASTDVYAFGALLLEVACGRRPIEPKSSPEELVLVDWVWGKFREGRALDVVDPKLNHQYNESEVMLVIKLGIMCSHSAPTARPGMRLVVRYLDGDIGILPRDVRDPTSAYDGVVEFDDFVLASTSSSSSEKMCSTHSYMENVDGGIREKAISLDHVTRREGTDPSMKNQLLSSQYYTR